MNAKGCVDECILIHVRWVGDRLAGSPDTSAASPELTLAFTFDVFLLLFWIMQYAVDSCAKLPTGAGCILNPAIHFPGELRSPDINT